MYTVNYINSLCSPKVSTDGSTGLLPLIMPHTKTWKLVSSDCYQAIVFGNNLLYFECLKTLFSWVIVTIILGFVCRFDLFSNHEVPETRSVPIIRCKAGNKEEWRYNFPILYVDTRRKWVVSFPPLPLYLRENLHLFPLDRRLGGPQSLSGRCGKEKNFASVGNRTPEIQPVVRRYTDWAVGPPTTENLCRCPPIETVSF
jgi:hypothetical protein